MLPKKQALTTNSVKHAIDKLDVIPYANWAMQRESWEYHTYCLLFPSFCRKSVQKMPWQSRKKGPLASTQKMWYRMWREVVPSSSRDIAAKQEIQNPAFKTDRYWNRTQKTWHCGKKKKECKIIEIVLLEVNNISTKEFEKIINMRTWDCNCRGYGALKILLYPSLLVVWEQLVIIL